MEKENYKYCLTSYNYYYPNNEINEKLILKIR